MERMGIGAMQSLIESRGYGYIGEPAISKLEDFSKLPADELADHLKSHWANLRNPEDWKDVKGNPCSKEDAYYIWVSTGISNNSGEPVFMAFVQDTERCKKYENAFKYFCYRVGTLSDLNYNMKKYTSLVDEKTDVERGIVKKPEKKTQSTVLDSIYNMLLIKGDWGKLPNYKVLNELFKLADAKIAAEPNKWCTYNSDYTKYVYNTGLINIYGDDILLMVSVDKSGEVSFRQVVQSKTHLLSEGFKNVDIPPIQFYEDRKDLIFKATIDDFDLDNIGWIQHIVEDRRDRFPEDMQKLSNNELVIKIRSSLEFDLKMLSRNPYWAAPFYNMKQNEIQYMLPLYEGDFSEKPVLAMIIGKGDFFYEVRTVIPIQSAYANAACLASPPSEWLYTEDN